MNRAVLVLVAALALGGLAGRASCPDVADLVASLDRLATALQRLEDQVVQLEDAVRDAGRPGPPAAHSYADR